MQPPHPSPSPQTRTCKQHSRLRQRYNGRRGTRRCRTSLAAWRRCWDSSPSLYSSSLAPTGSSPANLRERNSNDEERERDLEAGDEDKPKDNFPVFEEKILVIMAGDVKPTFLATPLSSKVISFGEGKGKGENEKGDGDGEVSQKPKQDMGDLDDDETNTTTTTLIEDRESLETRENQ
ncbi:glutamine dumper 1 [Actinidia rufa]|uniref:Glutamine dumper 1 n=1 Tax=Actinidia rufa TaxID=165716 RepID=A0A7J0DX93_9ERIC|nr:glutamine dumper 1 [Actinidia rufa]